ncbi:MAG: shikimate dehydrogenase [Myxococcota bacterium]
MTRVFGLIGHPVARSLSPRMHAGWIAEAGLDAVYHAFEAAPDTSGARLVDAVRTLGLGGVNLTVPFKERVVPHLDGLGPVARRTGAVNTIVARGQSLVGLNTDVPGFVAALREHGVGLAGRTVVVLGAGGAARAAVVGAAEAGAARIVVLNRTERRARDLVDALWAQSPDTRIECGALDRFREIAHDADLVTVAVARSADPTIGALDTSGVRADATWLDLNYGSNGLPQQEALEARGVRFVDGLSMLIHQGALAFGAFTGCTADPAVARRLLGGGIGA